MIWKGWFETAPCRATLATPFPALCPRILGIRFTNYGLRMFWGELMVICKRWFETVPCRATLNTPFSALCPRILGTRFTNYGLRVYRREVKQTRRNDICVATGMTIQWHTDRKPRHCTGKRLSRAIFLRPSTRSGMSHLCDSTVAGLAVRKDNALATRFK